MRRSVYSMRVLVIESQRIAENPDSIEDYICMATAHAMLGDFFSMDPDRLPT